MGVHASRILSIEQVVDALDVEEAAINPRKATMLSQMASDYLLLKTGRDWGRCRSPIAEQCASFIVSDSYFGTEDHRRQIDLLILDLQDMARREDDGKA